MNAMRESGSAARGALAALALAAFLAPGAAAEEAFGFGGPAADDAIPAAAAAETGGAAGASISGSVGFEATSYFEAADGLAGSPLYGLASGLVSVEAKGSSVDAGLKLRADRALLADSPEGLLDEAYVRAYAGPLTIEGGLLKVAWGKADSLGPLNVLNPMDYSDLSLTDERAQRIAQPMLHASLALGQFSRLELALLPGFEGDRYAWEGRWASAALVSQKAAAYEKFYSGSDATANGGKGNGLYASYYGTAWAAAYSSAYATNYATDYQTAYMTAYASNGGDAAAAASSAVIAAGSTANTAAITAATAACAASQTAAAIAAQAEAAAQAMVDGLLDYPDTDTLEYAQGGLRFTTSLGPVDLGLQYFYGFLPRPAANADPVAAAANGNRVPIAYNRYHQAGVDLAAVLLGLSFRAEAAANLTEDLEGDDPLVYNPCLAWSLGVDSGLGAGLSLNVQGSGSYRLMDDQVGSSAYDVEDGADPTSTRITASLSQKLFKDKLDWGVAAVYGVEDRDWLVMPSVGLAIGDARLELSGGLFGGDEEGDLGQYGSNDYARLGLSYSF